MPQRIDTSDFALVVPIDEPSGEVIAAQVTAALPGLSFTALSDIAEIARLPKQSSILLAISSPVEALARKLLSSEDVEAALADWKTATSALLETARKIRRRLWLVDARALALGDPATLDCFSTAPTGVSDLTVTEVPSPWLLLLAETLIERDPEAQRMAGEVAAMRRGAGGLEVTRSVCQAAFEGLSVLSTERGLLRDHVALQTEEAERQAGLEAELKAATDEIARLKFEAKAAKKSLAERTTEIDRLKPVEENLDLLLARLAKVQSDGAAAKGKPGVDEALKLLASLQTERTLLRENIQLHLEDSEQLHTTFAGAGEAVRAETASLKSEVEAAQAKAEKASSDLATAKSAVADRNLQRAKAEALQRRLDDMVLKSKEREALLGEALLRDQRLIAGDRTEEERRRAEALEAELHRVYASKSWRVTRPLRSILSIGKR
jgi:hypothetical protein